MEIQGLRTLVRSVNFATLGVPAYVERPSDPTVPDARVIWLTPDTVQVPADGEFRRTEGRRGIAVATQDGPDWHGVPTVPRGTLIEITNEVGSTEQWRVDGIDRIEDGHVRAIVVPA